MIAIVLMLNTFISPVYAVDKSARPEAQPVSGSVDFESGAPHGGDIYLTVFSAGSDKIKVEKVDKDGSNKESEKKPKIPDSAGRQLINLGRNTGLPMKFNISLMPGKYRIGCIVKISDPPCSEFSVNDSKKVTNCLPGQRDLICSDSLVDVSDSSVSNINIRVGLPAK